MVGGRGELVIFFLMCLFSTQAKRSREVEESDEEEELKVVVVVDGFSYYLHSNH